MNEINNRVYILAVDDNPQHLLALEAVLSELNQNLIFAHSAKEALRQVLRYEFSVILLDVHMPHMNGFELARIIRSRKKSSYTPIIFLSAINKEEADIDTGYAMGAVDYIFKPINPIVLRSKVKVFVDLFTKSTLAVELQNELKRRQLAEQCARKQQQQLVLAELDRISTMEEMTSTLAHELNQPLTTIINYVQGCIHRLDSGDYKVGQLQAVLRRTSQQAERAGEILHRVKNFVRKNKLYYEWLDINQLIINTVFLSQEIFRASHVDIKLKLSSKPIPKLKLDKIQIEQVILNLLRNSIEAMQAPLHSKHKIIVETKLGIKKTVIIVVRDNGPGINLAHTEKIFDLYFTTKANGMGVGLAICRTIIEAHGGNIIAMNNPGGGACFQITLPEGD